MNIDPESNEENMDSLDVTPEMLLEKVARDIAQQPVDGMVIITYREEGCKIFAPYYVSGLRNIQMLGLLENVKFRVLEQTTGKA